MIIPKKYINIILTISKIFFVGLILQFFLNTFISFEIGLTGGFWSLIRMRKELIIIILFFIAFFILFKTKEFKFFIKNSSLKWFILITIFSIIYIILISSFITDIDLETLIFSLRYSFSGFLIFIIFFAIAWIFFTEKQLKLIDRYTKLMKTLLVLGIVRWSIIWLMPKLLDFAGYDHNIHEGDIGLSPPVIYYTQYNTGYIRNQFLFERPISRGFFLIAFWPMFFLWIIKNKGKHNMLIRGGLYGLNIISTFSRAAWIAWIFLTFLLILTQYKRKVWKSIGYFLVPIVLVLVGVAYIGRSQIIDRSFSNTGHIQHIKKAIVYIKANPILGLGAGSAGPASHLTDRFMDYNPENQYLQIRLEYGLFGFIGWMVLYIYLHWIGLKAIFRLKNKKTTKKEKIMIWLMVGFSMGMLGLSIEGLVLHSFVDRMIVYPFTALFGMAYAVYIKENNSKILEKSKIKILEK